MKCALFLFCHLAVHLINAMPNQNEEEQVYFEYPERAEAIDNSQEFEEVEELPENREKREVGNLGESIHREKRRANYDSNPNLDVDVNVNIKAPQKDFKANVDVNVNINADEVASGSEEFSLCPLCGTRYFDRIIGGQDAAKGAWPWMAYLNIVSEYGNLSCGGSILTRDTILTAAHCITISNTLIIDIFVTVGSVVAPSLLAESILVVERIIHTDYDDDNVLNDIALLKLEQPLTFTRNVRPVCLGTSGMLSVGKKIDITGWGVMNYDYGITESHLQEVTVDMIGLDTCRNMYPQFTIDDRNICTLTEDKDACSGDSGGPMVSEEGDRFFQLGLVSYGIGCASPDSPNVASSIPYFTTWIMDNIGDIICE